MNGGVQFAGGRPEIRFNKLPEPDRQGAWLITCNLSWLDNHVENFRAAVALYDFCLKQQARLLKRKEQGNQAAIRAFADVRAWPFIAARDGAMTIYHFYEAFAGIRDTSATCGQIVSGLVRRSELRAARKIFDSHFPTFIDMRDSVAHSSEVMKTPQKFSRHAFSGTFQDRHFHQLMWSANLTGPEGRRYQNTWEGKIVSYDIDQRTLNLLIEARSHIWASLHDLAEETRRRAREGRKPTLSKRGGRPP